MEPKKKKEEKTKEIVVVEPKPIEVKKDEPLSPLKGSNINIGKISSLTLNVVARPLKKHYEKHYRGDKFHLIIDIVLAAVILILLGVLLNLWFFSRYKTTNLMDFQVSATPANIVNGQETEISIDYTNTTNDPLSDVTLILKTPQSLRSPQYSISDFDLKTNTLKIGELASKAHGQFKIKALLLGNFNEQQEFLAIINYKNKYGQNRQELFSKKFQLVASVLQPEIKMPAKVFASSLFTAQISVQNNSKLNFAKVSLKLITPSNYTLSKTDLGPALSDRLWTIGQINAGEIKLSNFEGRAYAQTPQNLTVGVEVYATYNDVEYLLVKTENSAPITFSKFNLSFIEQENSHSVAPGSQASYTIYYKNNESYALENVQLGLTVAGDYADNNFLAKTYTKKAHDNQVLFDQNDYPQLAKILPGQDSSIKIDVGAKSSINFTQYQENGYQLEARGLASFNDPQENMRLTIESPSTFTQIDSHLSLNTLGLFYTAEGDQIGVGTVPPAVGEYTSYWAIIRIINTNNKIKDLKITAKVPAGIDYTNIYNVTDGNQITFDENSRQLEWGIPEVNAFTGIFNPAPEARIQLAITPTANQIGQSPILLTDIKATATDEKTNAFLAASGQNISIAIFPDQSLNKVIQ